MHRCAQVREHTGFPAFDTLQVQGCGVIETMTERNPILVFLLPVITLGIYSLIWLVKTKDEMNEQGAAIPTAWLLIIPIAQLWFLWKYAEGVGTVTRGELGGAIAFVLLLLTGNIGMAVIQNSFNKRALVAARA